MAFLNNLINGISLGSVYAIIALGYTMVYGIAKMLNFAHGDIIMVGAYVCFFAVSEYGLNPALGIIIAIAICTVLGIIIERLAYKPLREATSLAVLITAIGVSYFLQNAAQLMWTSNPKIFPAIFGSGGFVLFDGQMTIPYNNACDHCGMHRHHDRAYPVSPKRPEWAKPCAPCSEDKGAAQLMGINVNKTISITFAIGSALAAIAGVLLCSSYPSAYPHNRLNARHKGVHGGGVRRYRLYPRCISRRYSSRHNRDILQAHISPQSLQTP